jgi:hypothetical protein
MFSNGDQCRIVAINAGYDLDALEEIYQEGINGVFAVEPLGE